MSEFRGRTPSLAMPPVAIALFQHFRPRVGPTLAGIGRVPEARSLCWPNVAEGALTNTRAKLSESMPRYVLGVSVRGFSVRGRSRGLAMAGSRSGIVRKYVACRSRLGFRAGIISASQLISGVANRFGRARLDQRSAIPALASTSEPVWPIMVQVGALGTDAGKILERPPILRCGRLEPLSRRAFVAGLWPVADFGGRFPRLVGSGEVLTQHRAEVG